MPKPAVPSTADVPGNPPTDVPSDEAAVGASRTHAAVKGERSPRLPHERDESSDSGTGAVDPYTRQAAIDAQSERRQTDRGEATDAVYQRTLRGPTPHQDADAEGGAEGREPPRR